MGCFNDLFKLAHMFLAIQANRSCLSLYVLLFTDPAHLICVRVVAHTFTDFTSLPIGFALLQLCLDILLFFKELGIYL